MNTTESIGFVAASLTTLSFVPQVWHTWRTREVAGVSLGMVTLFSAGIALWLWYGILLGALPIIAANAITLALTLVLLAMKIVFGRRDGRLSPPR